VTPPSPGGRPYGVALTPEARRRLSRLPGKIVFRIDESKHLIVVRRVDHRRDVYRPR
jgi:mRNA-degrading endonuclease RelE of RelBE toxin-antitoxin system